MQIVSISLDPQMLDPQSTTAKRAIGYGEHVTRYTVIIPTAEKKKVVLSEKVTVYGTGGKWKPLRIFKIYDRIKALIEAGKCDVISTQDPYYLGLLGYCMAKRFHKGFEVQVLGLYALSWMRVRLARFVLPRAGAMRILSEGLKERLLSPEFGMKTDERMHVVPIYAEVSTLGFDEEKLASEEREIFRKNNAAFQDEYGERFNFLTVSRLIPVKNISMQLAAVETLKQESPEILLHVVGDGESRATLESEVERRGLEDHVIFHGAKYHTELGTYFTQSDCFLLSSNTEGWGMVAIEAATAGLPIIMTDVGCAGSAIKDGESGIIIPVGDTEALTASMRRVIHDAPLRTALHEGALIAIENIATFEDIARGCVRSWEQAQRNTF